MEENHNDNEFEKEMAELKEWQDNQFNPGHYIGTGRIPRPLKQLSKYPWILIGMGTFTLIPIIVVVVTSDNLLNGIMGLLFPVIISVAFLYGGIARIMQRKKGGR